MPTGPHKTFDVAKAFADANSRIQRQINEAALAAERRMIIQKIRLDGFRGTIMVGCVALHYSPTAGFSLERPNT
ncbi:hypothetical protein AB1K56_08065 [Microbacterium sp. BWR-S6Y]|uniref:hypothetical protein n=1 Tax=Microbacterium sp. BWR-S6Y TaxID=3232073 RepID=UPI003527EE3D